MRKSTDSLNKRTADFLKSIPVERRMRAVLELKRRQRVVENNAMNLAAKVIQKAKRD